LSHDRAAERPIIANIKIRTKGSFQAVTNSNRTTEIGAVAAHPQFLEPDPKVIE